MRNQKGFTVIEVLLLLLVISVIGFGGYYVLNSQHNNRNNTKTTPSLTSDVKSTKSPASQNNTPSTPTQNYFTIKEWGVRAPYNGSLKLEYKLIPVDQGQAPYINLSSKELDNSSTYCASHNGYGGVISKYKPSDKFHTEAGDTGETATQAAAKLDKNKYRFLGDYYFYDQAQAVCGDNQSSYDIQTQTSNDIKSLLQKLEMIPS